MAGLSSQLQDYLGKSSSKTPLVENEASATSGRFSSWFSKSSASGGQESEVIDETSNGWFATAQNDPLLPSLVSHTSAIICPMFGQFCRRWANVIG